MSTHLMNLTFQRNPALFKGGLKKGGRHRIRLPEKRESPTCFGCLNIRTQKFYRKRSKKPGSDPDYMVPGSAASKGARKANYRHFRQYARVQSGTFLETERAGTGSFCVNGCRPPGETGSRGVKCQADACSTGTPFLSHPLSR